MKIRKRRKKENKANNNIKKSILILTMLICMIIAMITYYIYAYNHKYGNPYYDDKVLVSYKVSDYVKIEGDIVYLKNIDKNIINSFTNIQKGILNSNNILSIDVHKELYKNILSIMINYTTDNKENHEKVLTLNIDLKNNKLLTNDDILNLINKSYKSIATDIFNEYIKLSDDRKDNVIDSISDKELTVKEFNSNREKYIIRIREKIPDIINLFIEDDKVYYILDINKVYEVCYYTDKDKLNIKKELGKI